MKEAVEALVRTLELRLPQEVEDADRRTSTGLPQVARTANDGSEAGTEEEVVDAGEVAEI